MSGEVYIVEIFDSRRRTLAFFTYEVLWVLTYWLVGLLGFLIRDWRHLCLVFSLPSLIWITYIWVIPESLFWMCAKGKYDEAERILNKMAKRKGLVTQIKLARSAGGQEDRLSKSRSLENHNILQRNETESGIKDVNQSKNQDSHKTYQTGMSIPRRKMKHLFTDKYLRRHLAIGSLFMFTSNLIYYGIAFSTPTLAGNRHINFFLLGLPEISAKSVAILIGKRLGRRKASCIGYMISGLFLGAATFIPKQTASGVDLVPLIIAVVVIGKFGVSYGFSIIGIYVPELFPTCLRSRGHGIAFFAGMMGCVIAPIVAYVAKMMPWVPNVIYSVLSICACLLALVLPETLDRTLPQEIHDVHSWYREGKNKVKKITALETTCEHSEAMQDLNS